MFLCNENPSLFITPEDESFAQTIELLTGSRKAQLKVGAFGHLFLHPVGYVIAFHNKKHVDSATYIFLVEVYVLTAYCFFSTCS